MMWIVNWAVISSWLKKLVNGARESKMTSIAEINCMRCRRFRGAIVVKVEGRGISVPCLD
jgi:hypothetical protein